MGNPDGYKSFYRQKLRFTGKNKQFIGFAILFFLNSGFFAQTALPLQVKSFASVSCGNEQMQTLLPLLNKKRVGVITNITGMVRRNSKDTNVISYISIVDTLMKLNVNIKKIFGPEHGFRSDTDAGKKVGGGTDLQTGLPVVSLYGSNKKPTKEQLADIDVLIYDIQDIGVRFYTYISTMSYAMEACAENKKEFIVLDRPNPNGFYIDGPVMKDEFKSFIGLHNVPLVYGMTCGEYAKMVNEEGWLKNKEKCTLTVIPVKNYVRTATYDLPVRPSPNIRDLTAILLYPGMGLFEGTVMSLGRGTDFPFQVIGHPKYPETSFYFIPRETPVSKTPKYLNEKCYGIDLRNSSYVRLHPRQIDLSLLHTVVSKMKLDDFFDNNFNYHAGNSELQQQIKSGASVEEIRKSWQADLEHFKKIRKKYLLYPDF
jgi:uncharacterized protein YbbC (DUF1343 family)